MVKFLYKMRKWKLYFVMGERPLVTAGGSLFHAGGLFVTLRRRCSILIDREGERGRLLMSIDG